MERFVKNKRLTLALLLAPALLFFTVFVAFTAVSNIGLSFTSWKGTGAIPFVGLSNWARLLKDKDFWWSFRNTMIIFVGIFCIMIPCAFFLATVLAKKIKGSQFFQFVYFAPIVISGIMIGLIWNFILAPNNGLLNGVLRSMGLDRFALEWIGGNTLSPYSIAFILIWQWLGINTMIFLAGIKSIPASIYESATIDGSPDFITAVRITLPLIKESLVSSAILNIGGVFKVYEVVTTLTGGGPGYASCTLGNYMMIKMFEMGKFGFGATVATFILIVSFLLSIILFAVNKRVETYQF